MKDLDLMHEPETKGEVKNHLKMNQHQKNLKILDEQQQEAEDDTQEQTIESQGRG